MFKIYIMEFMWARKFKHLKLSMIYKWAKDKKPTIFLIDFQV